ncbi:MAG: hypothetical protein QXK37_04490 [Candidatus Woesearchaeota archaeon]
MSFFRRKDSISQMQAAIRTAFMRIKSEIEDHKEAINQNTNEIQSTYEYLCRLEMKIDKLTERVDELSLFLNKPSMGNGFDVADLTHNEQKVFVVLYANDQGGVSYKEIAHKTGFSENLVVCYVGNLIAKGVPIRRNYLNNEVLLSIDPIFKDIQAKANIVKLNEDVSSELVV